MLKNTIAKTPRGIIYELSEIPNNMFQFFILDKRTYKNGDKQYDIGAYLTSNPEQSIILDTIRGSETKAIQRLDEIINRHLEDLPSDDEEDDEIEDDISVTAQA